MPAYCIFMGQGLVADLQKYTLCSAQFSTCAPIVLYNSKSKVGGLYHLAGCSNLSAKQVEDLKLLKKWVNPTDAYVFTGLGAFVGFEKEISAGHVEQVANMFSDIALHFEFNKIGSFGTIVVRAKSGALEVLNYDPGVSATELRTGKAIENLSNDVRFLGERDERELSEWLKW